MYVPAERKQKARNENGNRRFMQKIGEFVK